MAGTGRKGKKFISSKLFRKKGATRFLFIYLFLLVVASIPGNCTVWPSRDFLSPFLTSSMVFKKHFISDFLVIVLYWWPEFEQELGHHLKTFRGRNYLSSPCNLVCLSLSVTITFVSKTPSYPSEALFRSLLKKDANIGLGWKWLATTKTYRTKYCHKKLYDTGPWT